ncbi:hypothetical protein L917_11459 [Phytophthora nicotianae]|uniref:Uncharacterized protein n=3 Tax=Phytophthora nicotianae TaxID=4792 RepID=W2Q1G7_PHYN3|nr:hypothetical protein PPTG_12765 [Phytophthora nicotianae INRA-310]ETI43023.1 hypothetical protein F443_11958 [Phytophthora nicotianae P1569]ETL89630.1 hypothetical protein L917_11459 [Phytophthora nicotianae]ETM42920.1 hypothetical protein L914_11507 [Phytophthora nicotianae]ETN06726.1 hypothetical protein PPTG_12765 [Phytophthora nicotianae INRA-310]
MSRGRKHKDDDDQDGDWATEYYKEQHLEHQGWSVLFKPSVIGATLAVAGRIVIWPLALFIVFLSTGYLSKATVLKPVEQSIFAFSENDLTMAAGCTGCLGPVKICMVKYSLLGQDAIMSATTFKDFAGRKADESLYDFSVLTEENLAVGARLDANGATCQSGVNEFGAMTVAVASTARDILDLVLTMNISIAPQMMREIEIAVEGKAPCESGWNIHGVSRLYMYPTTKGSANFASIPAMDVNLWPDYTECRPDVPMSDNLVGSKLALATDGEDLLAVVPDILKLFPYNFDSSLPPVSRVVAAGPTKYGFPTVLQGLMRAYYGGCRVRAVNTSGVYVEDTCGISKRWLSYGLMVHAPDDIPFCTTGDICIRNLYNSLWEWRPYVFPERPERLAMFLNTFRSRYADKVALSVLPGVVVMQMLLMGVISLYQVMSHKRSVLLTQVWAYRCQNGRMQVVYLAQVTYHIIYNSDLYMIGLGTGTLTTESVVNLTCSIFAFSYAFVNLAKARSGDQQLDRHFRLTWETMQIVITSGVAVFLLSLQSSPLEFLISMNSELLRKTSTRGAKYCGLNDACLVFKMNLIIFIVIFSIGLGLVAAITSFVIKRSSPRVKSVVRSARLSRIGQSSSNVLSKAGGSTLKQGEHDQLTSFERNCLGSKFNKLFRDCDDMAYVMYKGKRCTTVEALLLTGYLYYGDHIYQASSVMMLLVARLLPRKMLRTFNVLLLRWYLDKRTGILSEVVSCTWYAASKENHKLAGATPVA